ncbi:MAG: hypothetical protein IJS88_07250 [Alphaproteobacteria bacterium]|nr:hypothetical protein [Alphaproteobacteria bacterium]
MRLLFFICVLFFCNQISAQGCCSADSIFVEKEQMTSSVRDVPIPSHLFFELCVDSIEGDYDIVYRCFYPRYILASLGEKYLLVDVFTGGEIVVLYNNDEECYGLQDALKKVKPLIAKLTQ